MNMKTAAFQRTVDYKRLPSGQEAQHATQGHMRSCAGRSRERERGTGAFITTVVRSSSTGLLGQKQNRLKLVVEGL